MPEGPSSWNAMWIGITVFLLFVLLVLFIVLFQFIGLYIRALVSGARVSLLELIGMRLRKVNAAAIVNSRIQATRAGLDVTTAEMESHVLAGGDVQRVILAMIAAAKANIDLPWKTATAIDLAGRDILDAVPEPTVRVGQPGVTVSELRPMGVCEFESGRIEAISEHGMIEPGRMVKVVALSGTRPTVRAV